MQRQRRAQRQVVRARLLARSPTATADFTPPTLGGCRRRRPYPRAGRPPLPRRRRGSTLRLALASAPRRLSRWRRNARGSSPRAQPKVRRRRGRADRRRRAPWPSAAAAFRVKRSALRSNALRERGGPRRRPRRRRAPGRARRRRLWRRTVAGNNRRQRPKASGPLRRERRPPLPIDDRNYPQDASHAVRGMAADDSAAARASRSSSYPPRLLDRLRRLLVAGPDRRPAAQQGARHDRADADSPSTFDSRAADASPSLSAAARGRATSA